MKNMLLRTRITLSVFIAIFSVATVLIIYNNFVGQQLKDKNSAQAIHADKQIWALIVDNQLAKMRSQVQLFTRDRKFKKALTKNDVEKLTQQSKTSYNSLSSSGLISKLLITSTNGRILAQHPQNNRSTLANTLVPTTTASGKITVTLTNWEDEAVLSVVIPIVKPRKIS